MGQDINCIVQRVENLTIVDIAQIIAAIGTLLAAIFAMITTIQNYISNKRINNERHAMVKPYFKVNSIFEKRNERKIEFTIINLGFDRFNSLDVNWKGKHGVSLEIREVYRNDSRRLDYAVDLNFSDVDFINDNIKGSIELFYIDIFGKKYIESIDILIENNHNDLLDEDFPILKDGLINKEFE